MALRSDVSSVSGPAPRASASPSQGRDYWDYDDVGERLRARHETGPSLPSFHPAAPALPRPHSEVSDEPPRWFAGYRLSFSCDLEILDESH